VKIDKYEWDELMAGLTEKDRAWLEYGAKQTGFPPTAWTAIPALVTMAVTWATQRLAPGLSGSWSSQLDTAEGLLVRGEIADRRAYDPNTVRKNISRWRRNVRDP